ncbi:hypothetical protein D3M70_31135 [Pseudomonas sp. LS-2]|nr:hypothetical protein D3M70_31135 [Pseudomonas sp. LS-2]
MNLTTGEAEALTRGVEAEAVVRCGGRHRVIRRALALRQLPATSRLLTRYPDACDKTAYAIDRGFVGRRRVLVHDGIVVSHGHVLWSNFLSRLC